MTTIPFQENSTRSVVLTVIIMAAPGIAFCQTSPGSGSTNSNVSPGSTNVMGSSTSNSNGGTTINGTANGSPNTVDSSDKRSNYDPGVAPGKKNKRPQLRTSRTTPNTGFENPSTSPGSSKHPDGSSADSLD